MAADDVQQLSCTELQNLNNRLKIRLRKDILRIYSESLFCDVEFVLGSKSLLVNDCLLQVRAANFFVQLCSLLENSANGYDLDISTVRKIEAFIKDIYEQEGNICEAETQLVQHLKTFLNSPDSDHFSTPLSSPSDIYCREDSCTQKGGVLPSYYSIVSQDWEEDLAQQEFLIKSFCSILHKEQKKVEEQNKPKEQKTYLLQGFNNGKRQRGSSSLRDLKKAVEEDSLWLSEEEGFLLTDDSKFKKNPDIDSLKVKCRVIHIRNKEFKDSCNECGFFDAEDCLILNYDSLAGMSRADLEKSKLSTMDTGPDSGLATSAEDIPLDQESGLDASKSFSSSVSSECCVWDVPTVPQHTNLNSWADKAPHPDDQEIPPDFVDRVLEELVKTSKSQIDVLQPQSVSESNLSSSALNFPKKGFFIDASSLLDETEVQPPSSTTAQLSNQKDFTCLAIQDQNCSGNYNNGNKFNLKNDLSDLSDHSARSECAHADSTNSTIQKETVQNPFLEKSATLHSGASVGEEKPPSLIRSNTFELETEDDRLAILRQEYERRQGSLIFQRCVSQSSGPLSDGGSEQDQNLHCTSLVLPDADSSSGVMTMSLFPTHVVDDEIQTPDSLNSDVPDTLGHEKVQVSNLQDSEERVSLKETDSSKGMEQETGEKLNMEFSSLTLKEVASPLFSRRKTDNAPILSGAAPPLSPEKNVSSMKVKTQHSSSFSSAWVVDISDISMSPETRRKKVDTSGGTSLEAQDLPAMSESRNSSGLGFYIDLKNPQTVSDDNFGSIISDDCKISRQSSDSAKSEKLNACEFFVDLKQAKADRTDTKKNLQGSSKVVHSPENKLFSMFIDIGDKAPPRAKPELSSRLKAPLSPFSAKKKSLSHGTSTQSVKVNSKVSTSNETEHGGDSMSLVSSSSSQSQLSSGAPVLDKKKNSSYVPDDSEININNHRLPCLSASMIQNISNGKETLTLRRQHIRANSMSSSKNFSSINPSAASLSSASRQLSSQSLLSVEYFDNNHRKPMFSSCHASLTLEESPKEKVSKRKEEMVHESSELSSQRTADSNESSICSLDTYSVHTPDQSSATDDHSSERKDSFQNYGPMRVNEVIDKHFSGEKESKDLNQSREFSSAKLDRKIKLKNEGTKSFVRLSDLDREPTSSIEETAPSVTNRMSRSIPETSWIENKLLISRSTNGGPTIISSSSRSLSRLFPNLSMYSGVTGRNKTSSTEDFDTMRTSQISDISSMQSSAGLEYSTESTDISSGRGSPATQLGDDLLKMFLEEINTDVIVEVGGRRIKAHKCILSSRCQYFAAILSGGWVESAGNVISLQGFSFSCVHFALCHIYCGASTIPDQISIVELASLADMLSLEGLKDVIMYTLKVKYCHFFHKPCAVCSVGVLECLPLVATYGLDDIYRKSLRWITKYFVRLWPTKTFAALPRELVDKCYQQHVVHMNTENVLETVLCCEKLLSSIPTVRWAEPVFVLASRLSETCLKFMSENFCALLSSENFLSLGRDVPWNISRYQDSLVSSCERMPPDQSCRSYSQLCSVVSVVQGPDPPPEMMWHPEFLDLLVRLRDLSERTLIRQAARAARTSGWGQMPPELRRRIQDAACLVLNPGDHASSRYKKTSSDSMKQSYQRSSYSRNLDLHQVKMAMVQHARRANSDHHNTISSVVVRKNTSSNKTSTVSRRSAPVASNKPCDRSVSVTSQGRPKTWPAQVKSRYLEKRPNHVVQSIGTEERSKQLDAPVPQRRAPAPVKGILISSSDSSRNSSPAMKRSSNASSSNAKAGEPSSKSRSSSIVSNPAHHDGPGYSMENGVGKSSASVCKRQASVSAKNHSTAEGSKTQRKMKSSHSPELLFNGGEVSEQKTKSDEGRGQKASSLGTQSQVIIMSYDSLATESSNDDINVAHSEKESEIKAPLSSKSSSSNNALGHSNAMKKVEVSSSRTPLSLANKKAPPGKSQRKAPPLSSKSIDSSGTVPSVLPKKSVSYVSKSPNLSNTGSRLAIPLRTSRSVSSVPDKGHLKSNTSSELSVLKKPSRVHTSTSSKQTNSTNISNSSLAGRVFLSKSKKSIISGSNTGSSKLTEGGAHAESSSSDVHPTVGPRSGTFLKDEPTVLKNPVVENE